MTRPISKDTTNELLVNIVGLKQQLERALKALEIAKDTLQWYDDNYDSVVARNTLDEIKTALEQKD